MPKDTMAEPMEAMQLPADPTHNPIPQVSLAGDVEMPEDEEEQFEDATPDIIVEELDYEDVIEEETANRLDEQELNTQEADIEDSDAVEINSQKMPIS